MLGRAARSLFSGRQNHVGESLEPLDVVGFVQHTRRKHGEADIARRVDPNDAAAGTLMPMRAWARQRAELMSADHLASQEEAESNIGGRLFPAARETQLPQQLIWACPRFG